METDKGVSNDKNEVKEFIEESKVVPTEDTEIINEETPSSESPEVGTEKSEEADETGQPQEQIIPKEPEIKEVLGETLKERALRLEITRMKRENAKYRKEELFTPKPVNESGSTILDNYDPEQLKELKTILSAAANELGFVKKDELQRTLTEERRDEIWNSFLEKHPEYLSENDAEGVFYNQLKEEFTLYKEPTTAQGFQKLLNRSHDLLFGTKSTPLNIKKINAQQEKIKVASHSGGTAGNKQNISKTNQGNLRTDMLKGFSDDEISELLG